MELGRRIRERTGDGLELIDFALAVLRGTGKMPPPATAEPGTPDVGVPDDPKSRMFALDWLTERGWGKAKQVVEVSTGAAIEMPDMTQKTLDELQQIIATELDSESDGDVH
jgi:hypothetical protein